MSDAQQQPESGPASQAFRCEELGPDDVEIGCWGPILMPFACKRKKGNNSDITAEVNESKDGDKGEIFS